MNFVVMNQDKKFKEGEIIATFKLSGSSKNYIMYALNDYEEDESKIMISYIETDSYGYDHIIPIEEYKREEILSTFKNLLGGANE